MKSRKKQIFSMVLFGVLLFSVPPHTSKAAEIEQVRGTGPISVCAEYATRCDVTLSISNGNAKIYAYVFGNVGVSKIHAKVVLQKYSGGNWSAVKTYENTVETSLYSLSKTKAVSKGKYRVKAVFTIYKGKQSEKITKYSKTVTYA